MSIHLFVWHVSDMAKLTDTRSNFKPFNYPWAFDAFVKSEQMHWLWTEIPMAEDVNDWKNKLNSDERQFLTHLYRFFTQADLDIESAYIRNYLPIFPQPEVRMMLSSFAARECIHIGAYSYLVETLGMPDTIYNEFLQYKAMADKHNFVEQFASKDDRTIAQQMAVFSAFSEGMQLFSSFVMLVNFSRFGLMKGMGQVISWSAADESLHCESMVKLFRTFIKENIHIWTDEFKKEIYDIARKMGELEFAFIDLAFGMSDQRGLTKEEVKEFARFLIDRRLLLLGLKPEYKVKRNPLPWVEPMFGLTHTNFFEQRVTDYTKGSLTGSWSEVWGKMGNGQ